MDAEDGARRTSEASANHPGVRLLEAARRGKDDELEMCLSAGLPVDTVDDVGKQVMHYIARYGMLAAFHGLMAVDPNQINSMDDAGNVPLHCAVERQDSLGVLQAMLQRKVSVNERNKDGLTPLHVAAFCGNTPAVSTLIGHGAAVEARTEVFKTPLHLAAQNGHSSAVKDLLDKGADITAVCKGRYMPLHLAAMSPSVKAIETLLAGGADANSTTEVGGTPLYYAASYGRLPAVELLLLRNADANALDTNGRSGMHCAALHGRTAVLLPLINAGGMLDAQDTFGNTPLHYAAMNGHTEMVSLLHQVNASVLTRNKHGDTPLHVATRRGHLKVVEQLTFSRCDLHACDTNGNTACHVASFYGRSLVLRHLLSLGAPINRQNEDGDTCLHLAARHNRIQCVQELLNSNAYDNIPNKKAEFPIATAGAIARPRLEDWQEELTYSALMRFGPAENKHTPIVVYGESEAGKTALIDSMCRHKSNPGLLSSSETIYSTDHLPTLGIHIRETKLGSKIKSVMRIVEASGHHDFRALCAPCLRIPRAIHVLVLNQRCGYDELQAHATTWLDLARICMSRTSQGRALRLRVPLILVFSNVDSSALRVTKNPKNNLNSTNVAERMFNELQPRYKEWFDFGPSPCVMDCRVPFSAEMDMIAERLFLARKSILKEAKDVPRIVEKIESLVSKISRKAKQPWVPWETFQVEAGKKFFHSEDRTRTEAEVFLRRAVGFLHKELKVISFSTGPAKNFIVLDTNWFFEKVLPQLTAHAKRPAGLKPLTSDDEGHMFISEFEAIMASIVGNQPVSGMIALLRQMELLHLLRGDELRVLMPSWIPFSNNSPGPYLRERVAFAGRRLKLGGISARCAVPLVNALVLGMLEEYPDFTASVWPLGIRMVNLVSCLSLFFYVEHNHLLRTLQHPLQHFLSTC
eukprot:scpid34069/ scgid0492/ Ankyrin-1; Ankyrin-R; Erythrocyte ankyrin